MYSVDEIIVFLKRDKDVKNISFSGGFLNNVGEVCSRYGYGAVKVFLIGRKKEEQQSKALLKVLDEIQKRKIPKEVGTMIFKKLNAIKFSKGDK